MSQFGFRGSPSIQLSVSTGNLSPALAVSSTGATSVSTTAVTSSVVPAGARSGSPSSASSSGPAGTPISSGPRCCDTGRPIFTDPITGQTVCSCQYDLLSYQRLAGVGVPALSMYSAPYTDGMAAYFPALGADQAPFYTSTAAGLELKENLGTGATWPYPSVYHPYDAAFAGYPFNGYGMDLNGARRKNATRETTSTLKAWLNEHKKNPYPTKGEKIMLAIITKMTLTQVSTWFANARRRLKKENKMTWEPRNRVEDEDNNNDEDGDRKGGDNGKDPDSKDSGTGSSEDGDRPTHHRLELLDRPTGLDTGSEWSESRPDSGPDSPECLYERPGYHHPRLLHPGALPTSPNPTKPRIWSLADMASKEPDPVVPTSAFYSAGKLISPLASRGPPLYHHPAAGYVRPPTHHDFYRSLYGPTAHLPGGSGSNPVPGDVSLLETYSRTFGPAGNGMTSVLSKAAVAAVAAAASGSNTVSPFPPPGANLIVANSAASSSSSASSGNELHTTGLHTKLMSPQGDAKPLA